MTTTTRSVPTAEMYDGDFRNWVDGTGRQIPIFNPFTLRTEAGAQIRDAFPNNQIPKSLFDPFTVKALGAYQGSLVLKPNNGAAPGTSAYVRNNYLVTQGTELAPQTKFSIKGDHIFSEKDLVRE